MAKKVAVILSGCGFLDGAEVRESVAVLWALDTHDAEVECFSIDQPQMHVVDHLKQEPNNETRNVLTESARIARGQIKPVSKLNIADFDAIAFPGGFGVAKNLCNFAAKGPDAEVVSEVKNLIVGAYEGGKPILAVCIAPALVGLALKDKAKLSMTLGAEGDAAEALRTMGHEHTATQVNEFIVDEKHKVITTAAYMFDDARLKDLFKGVGDAVEKLLKI